MKKKSVRFSLLVIGSGFLVFAITFLVPSSAFGFPQLISYQGILKDDSGNYLTGNYSVQFKIYSAATGGSALWTETQSNVSVSSGKFSVQLGSISALDLDFDQNYWLSIKVGADDEMTPRVQLTSVGYAYRANVAEDVINGFTEAEHNTLSHKNVEGVRESLSLIAKTNFKLDASTAASANSLGDMLLDVFTDDTGISAIPSSNYMWRGSPDYDVLVSPGGIDADTVLMVHGNGSDASTTFPDNSSGAKTITANGDVQVDTTESVFGGASTLFDGTGDYLSLSNSSDWNFGTADFTVDLWVRFSATSGRQTLISYNGDDDFSMVKEANGVLSCYFGGVAKEQSWNPTTNTWYHIVCSRAGTTTYSFVNGVAATGSSNFNINDTGILAVGANTSATQNFFGWLDEIRISKGITRWTADFTPPSSEYSTSGGSATVISTMNTVSSSPVAALVIADETLNAGDITYSVSRNNGTNWTECPKETLCDISSQPSGTQMKWKVEIEDDAELNAIAVAL